MTSVDMWFDPKCPRWFHHDKVPVGRDLYLAGTDHHKALRASFFGPMVSPTPCGETAGRMGDGVLLVTGADGFSELKRARTPIPA